MLKIIVAAAAITLPCLLPGVALAEDWGKFYAEVYGGAALGTDTVYNGDDYAMGATWAAGAAFGVDMGNGFSLGIDAMKTGDAEYIDENATLTTFSVMAEGEYALALNDTFAVYGSLGLGAINVAVSSETTDDAWGAGYSVGVGVRADVTENMALFGELKHQDTFDTVELFDSADVSAPTNTALVGVRLSF
jgi:opacity protein-like surface antigen